MRLLTLFKIRKLSQKQRSVAVTPSANILVLRLKTTSLAVYFVKVIWYKEVIRISNFANFRQGTLLAATFQYKVISGSTRRQNCNTSLCLRNLSLNAKY